MFDDSRSFVSRAFLRSTLDLDYRTYSDDADAVLLARLDAWAQRMKLKETSAEGAFTQAFFVETWGFGEAGRADKASVTLIPKYRVAGEGAGGGPGEADVALGWFGEDARATPQVLCEFKDIRSALDAKQNRKGSTRSPVEQCLNYLRGARRGMIGNEPVQPWWGLVTDMNEFRLYWWDLAPNQFLRFSIKRRGPHEPYDLLTLSEDARFDRFLFSKLFQRDHLIAAAGRPPLLRLIERQWIRERDLEGEFYGRYRAVRERLFKVLTDYNPALRCTPTERLRLSQKLLDRFIFAFYCEDMGAQMLFPPQVLREHFKARSTETTYDPHGNEIWGFCKRLFGLMDGGGVLGTTIAVPRINGGLFAADPLLDGVILPNHVFAAPGQGVDEGALERDPDTLFYLCARYNYAARGDARHSLSLYTLGRIFEQSITELEYRAGELEGRDSVAKLSKREREGVFYTPESVVELIVSLTIEPWLLASRASCGWLDGEAISLEQVEAYETRLRTLRIVDPACGSGAFLIAAFRRLLDERVSLERERNRLAGSLSRDIDERHLTAEILTRNLFGVDLNPASVEIARLALWLHSARANAPLASLDRTIVCGNSLVGPDFWAGKEPDLAAHERVNSFDWTATFPEVFAGGGFDIVLGNPPYVSVQTVRALDPDVADYLQADRGDDTYQSARTGNFDLYLPFIEKGLRLLTRGGRMGVIAPSLWVINEHGRGLRQLVWSGRHLERWLDFKSHQIFNDATTYTALQVFCREPVAAVLVAVAPDGKALDIDWRDRSLEVPFAALSDGLPWLMATGSDRALVDRLSASCRRLGDPKVTRAIMVGLQTSADPVYHLRKLARGRYLCSPKGVPAYEVELEDEIMKPLISGPQAKRYETPETSTYLLFPYSSTPAGALLLPEDEMRGSFPLAWAYLQTWEEVLRGREAKSRAGRVTRPFDDRDWYRFGRSQNLDKQEFAKLIVAQTVPEMRVCADLDGQRYLNNVRVNGILAAEGIQLGFLLGVLNGAVANFVFKRISKPKRGGYFEANKQFIAPLPVPHASPAEQACVAAAAAELQDGWSSRRDLLKEASDRLVFLPRVPRSELWIWPDLPSQRALEQRAPAGLITVPERLAWASGAMSEAIAVKIEALQASIGGATRLGATFNRGELMLTADDATLLRHIYMDEAHGRLAEAYWRYLLLRQHWRDATAFVAELCRPPEPTGAPAERQFIDRVADLGTQVDVLAEKERTLNGHLFNLYGLTVSERRLVAAG